MLAANTAFAHFDDNEIDGFNTSLKIRKTRKLIADKLIKRQFSYYSESSFILNVLKFLKFLFILTQAGIK